MNHFKGKQFQKDVIIVAVGYYLRYNLSYREVQELLYDRGINVCHTTIYRWVQEYSKILYHLWKKKNKQSFYSWKFKCRQHKFKENDPRLKHAFDLFLNGCSDKQVEEQTGINRRTFRRYRTRYNVTVDQRKNKGRRDS